MSILTRYNVSDKSIEKSDTGQWVKASEAEGRISKINRHTTALLTTIKELEDKVSELQAWKDAL